jgi:hypothetical protein
MSERVVNETYGDLDVLMYPNEYGKAAQKTLDEIEKELNAIYEECFLSLVEKVDELNKKYKLTMHIRRNI